MSELWKKVTGAWLGVRRKWVAIPAGAQLGIVAALVVLLAVAAVN